MNRIRSTRRLAPTARTNPVRELAHVERDDPRYRGISGIIRAEQLRRVHVPRASGLDSQFWRPT